MLSENCFSCDFTKCVGSNGEPMVTLSTDCEKQKLYPSNQCLDHLLCEHIEVKDSGLIRCEEYIRDPNHYYCKVHRESIPRLVILHHDDFEAESVDPDTFGNRGLERSQYYVNCLSDYSKEFREVIECDAIGRLICLFHDENHYNKYRAIFTEAFQTYSYHQARDDYSLVGPDTGPAVIRSVAAAVEAVDIAFTTCANNIDGYAGTSVFCLIRY